MFPNESESKESIGYTVDYTIQVASLARIDAIVERTPKANRNVGVNYDVSRGSAE